MSTAAAARPDARAWFVLGMLCFVYVLNFLDRQLLSILAKPIQDDLQVTDGQLGLISGLYFALFYCLISIPVGWLADRTNRVRVLSMACALWSAATMACGFSSTYPQLVAARIAVGVGEAGGVPPSYAIISDYFAPGTRGTALGLFNLGPPLGQALGVAFGASIAAAYSWRSAFVVLGAVGVVTAMAVYLFVREPERGRLDFKPSAVQPAAATEKAGFHETVAMFFSRPVLVLVSAPSSPPRVRVWVPRSPPSPVSSSSSSSTVVTTVAASSSRLTAVKRSSWPRSSRPSSASAIGACQAMSPVVTRPARPSAPAVISLFIVVSSEIGWGTVRRAASRRAVR